MAGDVGAAGGIRSAGVVLGSFAIGLVGGALLRRRPPELDRHRGNRILGIIPGAISGVVSAAILSAFLLAAPLPGRLGTAAQRSAIARGLQPATERVEERLTAIFGGALGRAFSPGLEAIDRRTMKLPAKVTSVRTRPDLETRMLEMVNRERAAASLPPVRADEEMRAVARSHSTDMFARGYFSHYTPEGKSPFDRIQDAGYRFRTAGENLAIAPTLELAHDGLMKSPGHRANILRPQFGRLGIGIIDGGIHGVMVTQNFRN
jgi:uncharacterized protein YkwD